MLKNILTIKRKITWLIPVIFLFNISGCNSLRDKFTIVSNTNGEIEKIIIKTFDPVHYWMKYYRGLTEAIDSVKIIGIVQIIPSTSNGIKTINKNSFKDVLVSFMGELEFGKLELKYKDSINFNKFTDNEEPINIIPPSIKAAFDRDIISGVKEFSKTEFAKNFNAADQPSLIVSLDYKGEWFISSQNKSKIVPPQFFLQDVAHALQKYENDKKIKLVYSNTFEAYEQTVLEIIRQNPYIDSEVVSYKEFDGGNILPSENYVLVGENILHNNAYSPHAFKQKLKHLFNIDHIIFTGIGKMIQTMPGGFGQSTSQPVFHLDMFMTPAGKRNNKNLILIGQIDTCLYRSGYLDKRRMEIIDSLNSFILLTANNIKLNYDSLDTSPNRLDDFEFDTIPFFVKFGVEKPYQVCNVCHGDWYNIVAFASFNNAIVEITRGSNKIFLPNYVDTSYADFDSAKTIISRKLSGLGFGTIKFLSPPVDSIPDGALHCYTKVIWRKKY